MKFRLSAVALSVGLLSACSSVGQAPLLRSGNSGLNAPEDCRYTQRNLSVSWNERYYWCKKTENFFQSQQVQQKSKQTSLSASFQIKTGNNKLQPQIESITIPASMPERTEPYPVQDEISDEQIPVLTDVAEVSLSIPSRPMKEIHPAPDASVHHIIPDSPDTEAEQTAQAPRDGWKPLSEKIWFAEKLQVLGPKSSTRLHDLVSQLHLDKTIWLDGKLQLSDLTELDPERARLLSIGRALAVKKALREAGVKAPIRIKHPRLIAIGRFVVMEQKA